MKYLNLSLTWLTQKMRIGETGARGAASLRLILITEQRQRQSRRRRQSLKKTQLISDQCLTA